jgi:hypothetical protein
MPRTLKLSAPLSLGLAYPATVDVPDTLEGSRITSWWKEASEQDRAAVAKLACDSKIPITEAFAKHTAPKPKENE